MLTNLQEGLRFYADLSKLLGELRDACKSVREAALRLISTLHCADSRRPSVHLRALRRSARPLPRAVRATASGKRLARAHGRSHPARHARGPHSVAFLPSKPADRWHAAFDEDERTHAGGWCDQRGHTNPTIGAGSCTGAHGGRRGSGGGASAAHASTGAGACAGARCCRRVGSVTGDPVWLKTCLGPFAVPCLHRCCLRQWSASKRPD